MCDESTNTCNLFLLFDEVVVTESSLIRQRAFLVAFRVVVHIFLLFSVLPSLFPNHQKDS